MNDLAVYKWEDKEVYDVSGALLLISSRVSVDQLLEGLEDTKAVSLIAPYRLNDFGYTARSADTLLRNFGDRSVGVVVPMVGSRREREDFIVGAVDGGFEPIVFHERTSHPTLDRWLPYLEQADILVPGGWYHAAGREGDFDKGTEPRGRWTASLNFGEPS